MSNVINFNEYIQDREADRIADKLIQQFYPLSDCTLTIEEIETATADVIRQAERHIKARDYNYAGITLPRGD